MKTDFFNAPPSGYTRGANGWLRLAQTPQRSRIKKIQAENQELKARLESLEEAVSSLLSKKKK